MSGHRKYPVIEFQNESLAVMLNDDKESEIQVEMDSVGGPKLVAVAKGHQEQSTNEKNDQNNYDHQGVGFMPETLKTNNHMKEEDGDLSDFDADVADFENKENAWSEANIIEKGVLALQFAVITGCQHLRKITKGHFLKIVFLVGFTAYFIAAMIHKFGDEGSHRLLACTVLGASIIVFPYLKRFVLWIIRKCYGSNRLSTKHAVTWKKAKTVMKWVMYFIMSGIMIFTVIQEGRDKPKNLRSLPGIFIFILIAFLCSTKPSRVSWHTIFWSIALQFLCAVFVLKWNFGKNAFLWVQDRFMQYFDNSKAGSVMLFGENYMDHPTIFGAMPLLLFINATFAVLYYLGVMPFVVKAIGTILKIFLGVKQIEATIVSVTIFLEGVATIMLMRPFVEKMTKSQLFLLLTACMASIGGAVVGFLSAFGLSLEYLVPAMLISAPATFAIAKIMVPDYGDSENEDKNETDRLVEEEYTKYTNTLDAAQTGAMVMVPVLVSASVVIYTFMCWVSWINHTLEWFGDRVGIEGLSIELISSYLLYPVSLAMGVEPEDCRRVAILMGYRLSAYNVIAYLKLVEMKYNKFQYLNYMTSTNFTGTITRHRDDITLDMWNVTLTNGFISDRSEAIVTYCLAGFSSLMGAGLCGGVLITIIPKRKKWVSLYAPLALLGAHLANCMTGCFASLFY